MKIDSFNGFFRDSLLKEIQSEKQAQVQQPRVNTTAKPETPSPGAPAFGHYVTPTELEVLNSVAGPFETSYADEAAQQTIPVEQPPKGPFELNDAQRLNQAVMSSPIGQPLAQIGGIFNQAAGGINDFLGIKYEEAKPAIEGGLAGVAPFASGAAELAGRIPFLPQFVQGVGTALQGYQEHIGDPVAGLAIQSHEENPIASAIMQTPLLSGIGMDNALAAESLLFGRTTIPDLLTPEGRMKAIAGEQLSTDDPIAQAHSVLATEKFKQGDILGAADAAINATKAWGNNEFKDSTPIQQLAAGLLYDPLNFVGAETLLGGIGKSQKFLAAADATKDVTKAAETMKEAPLIAKAYDMVVKGLTGKGILASTESAEELLDLKALGAAVPGESTRRRLVNPITAFRETPLSKDMDYLNAAQDYVINMSADDAFSRADMKNLYKIANQAANDKSLKPALDAMGKHKITNSKNFQKFVNGALGFEPSAFADETYNQMASLRESIQQWSRTKNPSAENLRQALMDSRPFKDVVEGLVGKAEGKKKTYLESYQGAFRRFEKTLDAFNTGKAKPQDLQNAVKQLDRDIEIIGKLHLGSEYADNVQKVLQDFSQLPVANLAEKFINKIKPYESVLFIATNPHAISVNVIGNWIASAIHGVSPWESAANVKNLFGRIYGTDDTKQVVGRIGEVLVAITKDQRYAHDLPLGAQLPKVLSHNPFSKLWQSTEYNANLRAFTTGFTRAYKQVWKYGKEIPPMAPDLERAIKSVIGEKQFKRLINSIEDSYNTKELKAAVNSFFEQPRWQEYRDEIAVALSKKWSERMGKPIKIDGELLDNLLAQGSSDRINQALRNAYRRAMAGENMADAITGEAINMANEAQQHRSTVTSVMNEMRRQAETPEMTVEKYVDDYMAGKGRGNTPEDLEYQQFAANNVLAIEAEFQRRKNYGTGLDNLPTDAEVVAADDVTWESLRSAPTKDIPENIKNAVSFKLDEIIPKGVKVKVALGEGKNVKTKIETLKAGTTIGPDGGVVLADGTKMNSRIIQEVFDADGNSIWIRLDEKMERYKNAKRALGINDADDAATHLEGTIIDDSLFQLDNWENLTPEQRINSFKDEANFLDTLKEQGIDPNSATAKYYQDRIDKMLPMYNEMLGLPKDTPLPPRKKIVAQPHVPGKAKPEKLVTEGKVPKLTSPTNIGETEWFHGSEAQIIGDLKPAPGVYGTGVYLSTKSGVDVYGPNVVKAIPEVKNPYIIEGGMQSDIRKGIEAGTLDSDEVTKDLISKGYDGIFVKGNKYEEPILVAFNDTKLDTGKAIVTETAVQTPVAATITPAEVEMRKERLTIRQQRAKEWLRKHKRNDGQEIGDQVDSWTPEFIDRVMANQVPGYENAVVGFKETKELGPIENIFVKAGMPDEQLLKLNRAEALRKAADMQLPMHTTVDEFIPDEADFRAFAEGKNIVANPAIANVIDNWRPYGVRKITDTAKVKGNVLSGWKDLSDAEKVAYWNTMVNYVPRNKRTYAMPMTRGEFWEQARVAFRNLSDQQFDDTREIVDRWAWTIAQRRKWSLDETYSKIFAAVEPGKSTSRFIEQGLEQAGDVGPNGFYSKLVRSVEQFPNKVSTADIIPLLKKYGVKDAEMKWTDLDEFIQKAGPSVSKQELVDYVKTNQVRIREVMRGEEPYQVLAKQLGEEENGPGSWDRIGGLGQGHYKRDAARLARPKYGPDQMPDQSLPGAQNYRELELIWDRPGTPQFGVDDVEWFEKDGYIQIVDDPDESASITKIGDNLWEAGTFLDVQTFNSLDEAKVYLVNQYKTLPGVKTPGFQSSHWDEQDILAHVRFDDRIDADGKKVLFIEEIQSDWAQQGRKLGFNDAEAKRLSDEYARLGEKFDVEYEKLQELQDADDDIAELKQKLESINIDTRGDAFMDIKRQIDEISQRKFPEQWQRFKDVEVEFSNAKNPGRGIPTGPFVTKTEEWTDLVTKRMLRYAAENGYDRVGWITGTQQVERNSNSLRGIAEWIEWGKEQPRATYVKQGYDNVVIAKVNIKGQGVITLDVDKNTGKLISGNFEDNQLSDVIGEQMAQQVIETPSGLIDNQNIVVGGKGLTDFYDKIIPNSFNKQGKKFGAKPSKLNLESKKQPQLDVDSVYIVAFGGGRDLKFGLKLDEGISYATPEQFEIMRQRFNTKDEAKRALNNLKALPGREAEIPGEVIHTMDIPDSMRESVLRDGFALFQDPTQKGSITWVNSKGEALDGRAIIRAVSESHDATTAIHEVVHAFLPWMDNEETAIFEAWTGLGQGDFKKLHAGFVYKTLSQTEMAKYRDAQEKVTRGFELYMRNGKAPIPELKEIFDRFAEFFRKIYQYIKGSPLDIKLSDEMQELFDSVMKNTPPSELVPPVPATVKPTARAGRMLPPEVDDDWIKNIKPEDIVKPEVMSDAENMFVDDIMEEVRKLLGTETALPMTPMPKQLMGGVNSWIDNMVNPRQREVKQMATSQGRWYQGHTVLNYNKRWNVDDSLSFVAPFTFWPVHMMANMTQEFIDRPALLNFYMRLRESYNDWSDSQTSGMPERFKGRVKLPMPFLPNWMDDGIWVNPFKTVMPVEDIYHLDDLARAGYTTMPAAQGVTEVPDMGSFVSDFFGLHLPWKLAMDLYSGDKANVEDTLANLPPTRIFKALGLIQLGNESSIAGINPTKSKWDAYYIERAARDMLAEGLFGDGEQAARNFKKTLLERSGPLWQAAVERARQQNYAGSVIPGFVGLTGKVYTQGEQIYANARLERDAMLDNLVKANGGPTGMTQDQKYDYLELMGANGELNKVYDTHPELAGSNIRSNRTSEDDEKLYRNWLVDSMWNRIGEASDLEKRLWRAELGQEFDTYFYKKATSNLDMVDTPTLAGWANAMKLGAINASESEGFEQPQPYPAKITFPTEQQNKDYQDYYDGVEKMVGWEEFYNLVEEYNNIKDKDKEKAKTWLNTNLDGKRLKAIWDAEDELYKKNPGILKLLEAAGITEGKQRLAPAGSDQAQGQAWEAAMYAVGYTSYDEYKAENDAYKALPVGSEARAEYRKTHPRLVRMLNVSGAIYDTDEEVMNNQKGSGAKNFFENKIIAPDSNYVRFPRPTRNPAGLPEGLTWAKLGPLLREFGSYPPGSQERQLIIDQNPELSYYFRMTPAPNMRIPYYSLIKGRINYQPKQFTQFQDPTTSTPYRKKIKYT